MDKQPQIVKSASLQSWIVCLCASLFFFFEFMQMHLFNSISDELMRDLQLQAHSLSYLSTSFLVANTLFLLPAGLILDRLSTRSVIMYAMLVCIIGTFIFALTSNFWFALLGRFMAGIGNAFCFLSCLILITRWFPESNRALVTGIVVTFALVGGIFASAPFRFFTEIIGWRNTVLLDAAIGTICLFIISATVKDYPTNSAQAASQQALSFLESIKLSLQNWHNILYGIYAALMNLPIIVLAALWGSLYLNQIHHINMTHASFASSMIFFGMIFGAPLFGAWSDHMGVRRMPMIIGAIISLLCITAILLTTELGEWQAIIAFFLLGFFTSTQILVYPKITEINPQAYCGTALAVASTVIMGVAAVAQPTFGYLMQINWHHHLINNVPLYSSDNYFHAMTMIPVGFAISLVIALALKENQQKKSTL